MANHPTVRPRNAEGQFVRGAAPAHATLVAENKSTRTLVGLAIATGYVFLAAIGTVVVGLVLGRPVGIGNLLPVATHILIHYVLPFVAFNAIGVALVLLIQWIAASTDDVATIKQQLQQ
jgi:hypothetical protein